MRTYLYLLYEGGELAGLESGVETSDLGASKTAARLLGPYAGLRVVEVWRNGRLIDLVGMTTMH